jgi:hypothetical protein
MQTLIQVVCSKGQSLRDVIVNDPKLGNFGLELQKKQQPGRPHGWAKLHSLKPDRQGALNIEWGAATSILSCRIVNRGKGRPNKILSDFIDYLFAHRRGRIQAVNIYLR